MPKNGEEFSKPNYYGKDVTYDMYSQNVLIKSPYNGIARFHCQPAHWINWWDNNTPPMNFYYMRFVTSTQYSDVIFSTNIWDDPSSRHNITGEITKSFFIKKDQTINLVFNFHVLENTTVPEISFQSLDEHELFFELVMWYKTNS